MRDHSFGCACMSHAERAWRRPEHWTRAEVHYLETWYGRIPDEKLAARLGRTVTGIILKKRRLNRRKGVAA